MTSDAYLRVTDALTNRGSTSRDVRQNHSMWQCPAHEDNNPSLAVDDRDDRVLVRCHAGCNTDEVVEAVGLELKDLFDGEPSTEVGQVVRSYLYEYSNGEPAFYVDRYFPKTFRQRLPGTEPGDKRGLQGRAKILYHAPRVWRCMQSGDCTVWLVEGEKDVEACERNGLIATCAPGGVGNRWDTRFSDFLRHAKEVVIVADQDKEKPNGTLGTGQQYAAVARAGLRAAGITVRVVAPAVGKDAADHFAGGYGVEDFVTETSVYTRPRGLPASTLMEREFKPLSFVVDKILPPGITICAAAPKIGKSWLALDACLAVTSGGKALGFLPVTEGSAIYLAREDTYRRLQSRISLIMGQEPAPKKLELVPAEQDWVGGEEGLANLTEWADEVRDPRLVVIDTLVKVEPEMGESSSRGAYAGNYSMMARYKQWADTHPETAVVMVHHDRKGPSGAKQETGLAADPFSRISGTRGLTGAADTLWVLDAVRGEHAGQLHITGRDVAEQTVELQKTGPLWWASTLPE